MKYRYLLTDLDKTVIHDRGMRYYLMPRISKFLGTTRETTRVILNAFFEEIGESYNESKLPTWKSLLKKLKIPYEEEKLVQLDSIFWHGVYDSIKKYPDVASTLKTLRENGVKIIAVSGGDKKTRVLQLKSAELYEYFDKIVTSSEYNIHKATVDLYKLVVEDNKIPIDKCLVVGNSEQSDILLPSQDGFTTVKIMRGLERFRPTSANYRIDSYKELLKIFEIE